jgi:hypothetical protein
VTFASGGRRSIHLSYGRESPTFAPVSGLVKDQKRHGALAGSPPRAPFERAE